MNRYLLSASLALVASVAAAAPPFGEVKDSLICADGIERLGPAKDKCEEGFEPNLTPECKAEAQKRVDACKQRPDDAKEQAELCKKWGYDLPDPAKDLNVYCRRAVWAQMVAQSREAAKAALEVPTATMHDPKLEKAVAAAYVTEGYKENKILKVVLLGWAEDLERTRLARSREGTCRRPS
jgi:hypothetical protein